MTGVVPGITVVLGQPIDLDSYRAAIAGGHRPRHALLDLADRTGGVALSTFGAENRWYDRLCSNLIGHSSYWWLARRALARSSEGYIHANNEAVGFPLLVLQRLSRRRSIRIGFWVMTPDGRRVSLWFRLIRLLRLSPLLLAENEEKAETLRRLAGPTARVTMLEGPIDLDFFSPGPAAEPAQSGTGRPLVASAGLEKRDYRTLAAAVEGLDVDVRICAHSPDAHQVSASMPDQLPSNVAFVDLTIEELRGLYREADLVVVPTLANTIDAGSTTVMEALACGAAVVATAQGIYLDLADEGLLRLAEVASVDSWHRAIVEALEPTTDLGLLRSRARTTMEQQHNAQQWITRMIDLVRHSGVPVGEAAVDLTAVELAASADGVQPDGVQERAS